MKTLAESKKYLEWLTSVVMYLETNPTEASIKKQLLLCIFGNDELVFFKKVE